MGVLEAPRQIREYERANYGDSIGWELAIFPTSLKATHSNPRME